MAFGPPLAAATGLRSGANAWIAANMSLPRMIEDRENLRGRRADRHGKTRAQVPEERKVTETRRG